jgi:hypothetical protein
MKNFVRQKRILNDEMHAIKKNCVEWREREVQLSLQITFSWVKFTFHLLSLNDVKVLNAIIISSEKYKHLYSQSTLTLILLLTEGGTVLLAMHK